MSRRFNGFDVLCVLLIVFCAGFMMWYWPKAQAAELPPAEIITVERVEIPDAVQDSTSEDVENSTQEEDAAMNREATAAEIALAKMVWGEARGCSTTERAAVVWCVLNRVDAGYGTITSVVTEPGHFVGYDKDHPVDPEILALVQDVLDRWWLETTNSGEVGRVLPADYLWFHGDGTNNHFRNAYRGGDVWDWSLPSPYMEG